MRRFGDPSAKVWRSPRSRLLGYVIAPLVAIVVPLVLYGSIGHWAQKGEFLKVVFVSLALLFGLVVAVVALAIYQSGWRRATSLVRAQNADNPSAHAFVCRVPRSDTDEGRAPALNRRIRLEFAGPAVACFHSEGMSLWNASGVPVLALHLGWAEIGEVIAAEYVEGGMAFEGLAVVAPSGEEAILLQVVTPKGPFVAFTGVKSLVRLAVQIDTMRSAAR